MLTAAQMIDARRYMGYQAIGTTINLNGDNDLVYASFGMVTMSLDTRLKTLAAAEEAVLVNTYLVNLTVLESAIVAASANLDTDQAAVWKHNKNEVSDRDRLFDSWRKRLCGFLGFPCGDNIGSRNSVALMRA